MNSKIFSILKFPLLFLLLNINTICFSQCKVSQLVDDNKVSILPPYKYDGFLMNEFTFDLVNKNVQNEFVAFKNQKYQLCFYSSGFEEIVIISIYDKSNPAIKIAEKEINKTQDSWTYEPPKPGTYSIIYEVSPSETTIEHPGCIVMLIAFTSK